MNAFVVNDFVCSVIPQIPSLLVEIFSSQSSCVGTVLVQWFDSSGHQNTLLSICLCCSNVIKRLDFIIINYVMIISGEFNGSIESVANVAIVRKHKIKWQMKAS